MSHDSPRSSRRRVLALAAAATLAAGLAVPLGASAAGAADSGLEGSELFLNPWSTTLEAAQGLSGQARTDAQLLGSIPSADWFTKGTPAEVEAAVDEVVTAAANRGEMPVLVAYNLPFRDCAQYSAGGALNTAEYTAWIDGFAAGIGDRAATVILEPDGLGIIPHYVTINGDAEWCQPAGVSAATAASARFEQLNYAVDALKASESTAVYLDGTHSGWLGVGDISHRLLEAGVERADGFFLNASNYVLTERLHKYGSWISQCIELTTQVSWWQAQWCASQYYPASPGDFSTWTLTDEKYAQDLSGAGVSLDPASMTHFVIDTSRNGQGPWTPPAGVYSDAEDWCNPPDRGLGLLPDTTTGVPLVDAYLWIKVPGESDGKCYRGTPGPLDPERGIEDPAAGQWFVEQARELVALSNPPVAPLTCEVKVTGTKVGKGFLAALVVRNNSTSTLSPWTLSWSFDGDQQVKKVVGGTAVQSGADVTVTAARPIATLRPGKTTAIAVTGTGAAVEPWQFHLNGKACTTR
ncbi:glycoside hydrolase family 6 protein [Microbacterium sp. 2FI]|uniref:glycoside hydrolase family 6 protein n=1 Tax=Microbacterium sp. 2FI TaxID=2502193 RepID=UPI0010F5845B|nr:glycoside hydrolase family 6 protein [Microbacterium sp. 2FI]